MQIDAVAETARIQKTTTQGEVHSMTVSVGSGASPTSALRRAISTSIGVGLPIGALVSYTWYDTRELSRREVQMARFSVSRLASARTIPQHRVNLQRFGATVLTNVLTDDQVKDWRLRLASAMQDPNETSVVTTNGREHCEISDTSSYYKAFLNLLAVTHGATLSTPPPHDDTSGNIPMRRYVPTVLAHLYFADYGVTRYELTQLQFLNAPPDCFNQIWHRDNVKPGLTMLVALDRVDTNGPTELLLQSHDNTSANNGDKHPLWKRVLGIKAAKQENDPNDDDHQRNDGILNQPLLACLDRGDAILYDARLLHRGRGYRGGDAASIFDSNNNRLLDRPVLVVRWDALATPPPGCGVLQTTANDFAGSLRCAMLLLYRQVASWL